MLAAHTYQYTLTHAVIFQPKMNAGRNSRNVDQYIRTGQASPANNGKTLHYIRETPRTNFLYCHTLKYVYHAEDEWSRSIHRQYGYTLTMCTRVCQYVGLLSDVGTGTTGAYLTYTYTITLNYSLFYKREYIGR